MSDIQSLVTENLDVWTSALQTKSGVGRGSSKKLNLYGIKKLRELILELAVRGKLVPQDENDEPASVLLERIAAEKERLIKEKKIKKPKKLPKIGEDEKPFELPKGWEWARLGGCVNVIRGITFPASEKHIEPSEGRVACLRTANVQEKIEWDDLLYVSSNFVKREEQYMSIGDVVMSMANSRELVGKVAYVNHLPKKESTFGGFLSVLRPWYILPSFVMILLRTPMNRNAIIGSASQTTNIANISLEKLNPLPLLIPPLPEQYRIVAKVNELMALCDQLKQQTEGSITAHKTLVETLLGTLAKSTSTEELSQNWNRISEHFDTLFTTEHSIDQLKQTVLQLAVMGNLVPQDPDDEPASVLLERIAAEKERLVKEKKIKKQKPLPPISEDEKPFELPRGWEWCRLPDVGELARGKSKHRPRNDIALYSRGNIPLVQTGDVARANRIIETFTALYNEIGLAQSRLWKKGTMCITIAANIADTGILGFDACFPDSVVGFLPFDDRILVDYFMYFIKTAKNHLEEFAPSTAQKNINLEILGQLLVPCPPLGEQHRIVAKVNQLMALCDQLKARLVDARTTQLNLADAIVEKAVR